jgi:hypothetical protein
MSFGLWSKRNVKKDPLFRYGMIEALRVTPIDSMANLHERWWILKVLRL